jgi:predicted Fe-S protein YdhL (DUF1289 family)
MSNDPARAEDAAHDAPLTPCIGTCRLDPRGYCIGCQRSGEEIGRWRMMSQAERRYVMQQILPLRRQP